MGNDAGSYQAFLELVRTIVQPAVLLSVAGALLSLIASYVPGLNEWFAGQGEKFKPLCMLGAITLITVVVGVLSFTLVLPILPPTSESIWVLIFSWVSALWTNQTVYKLSPPTQAVKAIKETKNTPLLG